MGNPTNFVCKNCGKGTQKKIKKGQQYCSPQCSVEARRKPKEEVEVLTDDNEAAIIIQEYVKKNGNLQLQLKKEKLENKLLRSDITKEYVITDLIQSGIKSLPKIEKLNPIIKSNKTRRLEEAVLLFSDLHAAEIVSNLEMDGLNEYNFDIFCRRMQCLQDSMTDCVDIQRCGGVVIDNLNIFSLGDLINGDIHFELEKTNEMPLITSAFQVSLVVAQFLCKLSTQFKKIRFFGVTGNHGRKSKDKAFKQRFDCIEWIIYQVLPLLTAKYSNIEYFIPQSPFMVCEIFNWKYLLTHGDSKLQSVGGIPYYGIKKLSTEFNAMYRERGGFDMMVMGHLHNPANLEGVMLNSSIVGGDEFSAQAVRKATKPSQKFFGVSEKYLHTWMYDLFLDDIPDHHDFIYNKDGMTNYLMREWVEGFESKYLKRR